MAAKFEVTVRLSGEVHPPVFNSNTEVQEASVYMYDILTELMNQHPLIKSAEFQVTSMTDWDGVTDLSYDGRFMFYPVSSPNS